MTNKNYAAGRRFEYEVKKKFESRGYTVMRTAGSHGPFDLVAYRDDGIILIQCKLVSSETIGENLKKKFKENPPIHNFYHPARQCFAYRVKGDKRIDLGYV